MDRILCGHFMNELDEETKMIIKANKEIDQQIQKDRQVYKATHRLLLLGAGESGKSTIVKQMKILHINGFSEEERKEKIEYIKQNVRDAITEIIKAMSSMTPMISLESMDNDKHARHILEAASSQDFSYSEAYFDSVEQLWRDKGVQTCYERSNEYQLIDCAKYFLDKVHEIRKLDYIPNEQDILRCRLMTTGIVETKFEVDKVKFHIFDVGGQRDERRKWIQCFNDVTAIIFVCASSSYNMVLWEDKTMNRLRESLNLFHSIWTNRWLRKISIILFLNKHDLLTEKIKAGRHKLEDYFPGFRNYQKEYRANFAKPSLDSDGELKVLLARHFIEEEFLKIAAPLVVDYEEVCRKCYPHFTCAVDTDNIRIVFNACRQIIQKIHLQQWEIL